MTDVDQRMTIRLAHRPASSLELLLLFVKSLLVAGVFASALYAGIYVAQDMRRQNAAPVAANVEAPAGLELLTRASSAAALQRLTGFAAVLPDTLPAGTSTTPRLDATQPDAQGQRVAEIRYTALRDASGVALGPSLLLREWRAAESDAGRAAEIIAPSTVRAQITCGGLTVEARVYFPAATSDVGALQSARPFVEALSADCDR